MVVELRPEDRSVDKTLPPHSIYAEEAVLGSILKSASSIARVADILRPEYFYEVPHRHIFRAMLALFRDGQPVDYQTIADRLQQLGLYEPAGGVLYLSQLNLATPTASLIDHYAAIVQRTHMLRRLISAAHSIAVDAYRDPEDTQAVLARAESLILACRLDGFGPQTDWTPQQWTEAVMESISARQGGELAGYGTGLHALDRMTLGLRGGKVYVLCARTSVGKSVLALQIAENVAAKHGTVLYASGEMKPEELGERLVVSASGVDAERLATGSLELDEGNQVMEVLQRFAAGGLYFRHGGIMDVPTIRANALRWRAETGRLALIVVDYVQQLEDLEGDGRSRERNVALASSRLKRLAVELDVPIIAVAQLNRDPEHRVDKRPVLSDLRESGAIENDADMVVAMYREEMYSPSDSNAGLLQLIMLKNRAGVGMPAGQFRQVIWVPNRHCYADWAKDLDRK
jgi:replicative DNA helicase